MVGVAEALEEEVMLGLRGRVAEAPMVREGLVEWLVVMEEEKEGEALALVQLEAVEVALLPVLGVACSAGEGVLAPAGEGVDRPGVPVAQAEGEGEEARLGVACPRGDGVAPAPGDRVGTTEAVGVTVVVMVAEDVGQALGVLLLQDECVALGQAVLLGVELGQGDTVGERV